MYMFCEIFMHALIIFHIMNSIVMSLQCTFLKEAVAMGVIPYYSLLMFNTHLKLVCGHLYSIIMVVEGLGCSPRLL